MPENANRSAGPDAFDRQVAALAPRLRQDGIKPAEDLWPALSAALDAAGPPVTAGDRSAARRRRASWSRPDRAAAWPAAAMAAVVLVAIGVGLTGRGADTGAPRALPGGGAPAALSTAPARAGGAQGDSSDAARDGLRAVSQALDQVQAALDRSPDDPDLSRLVMLIHHSRGRLLRLQAEDGVRDSRRRPA